ncbi:unnamed protein product [Gongylonema pulchrum]|uniref:DM domain-containing protein n=1 Tax=Gongylonema pulchrum TaxID=637853 RepID=A0A183CU77_9BILA|nr:unnamed protein product [Gongylonema pulchrum]
MGFDMTQLGYYAATLGQHTTFTSLPLISCMQTVPQPDTVPVSSSLSVILPIRTDLGKARILERVPNCQKCGQHGRKSRLKGHKRVCPYRDCDCAKCQVVSERQKLMADQIKIRRRQRKDTLLNITRENITATLNAAAASFLDKQLQQNMRHPVTFLPGQSPPSENTLETSSFCNSSGTALNSYLASSPSDSLKRQQQQPSPPALPHLQFLFQPQFTTAVAAAAAANVTTTCTKLNNVPSPQSLTPPCTQSEDPAGTVTTSSPPIAVPVAINPVAVSGITSNLTNQNALSRGLQQQQHQQQHQQQQQLSQVTASQLTTGQIPAFLDNDQLFQTLLNNMRLLERKISMEAAEVAAAAAAGANKTETNHIPSAFVDIIVTHLLSIQKHHFIVAQPPQRNPHCIYLIYIHDIYKA